MSKQASHLSNPLNTIAANYDLWVVPVVAAIVLLIVEQIHFLLFHTLAETVSIVIAFMLFATAWATSRFEKNAFLIYLGCGYFWVGLLHLAHGLAYKGVFVQSLASGDMASELWIAARYFEALLLLSAPFVIRKAVNKQLLLVAFGLIAVTLFSLVMLGLFPTTFVEGSGLTPFKVYSEYAVIGLSALTLVVLHRKRALLSRIETHFVFFAIVFSALSEFMFTLYADVYGMNNLLGHLFKLTAFWMIYRAVVVTTLVKPYEELEENRNYNRQLFNTSSIGLVLMRMDGTIIDANPAFARTIGRGVQDTLGLTHKDITSDDLAQIDSEQLDILNKTGRYGPYVKHYLHRDGHLVPVQVSGTVIDHHGEPCIWSSVEDISERFRAESKVQALSERIHKLAAHLPGFIYQFRMRPDGTMHMPYASEGIASIYACAPEDVAEDASTAFERIHSDDLPRIQKSIRESAESLSLWREEFRIVLPDGETIWALGESTPSKEDDGSVIWHGFIHNISDRIQVRQELVHERDRLHEYLNLARAFVLALNRDGEIILVNDYACSIMGYDKAELTGRNWFDIALPTDIREEIRQKSLDILQGRREPVSDHEKVVQTRSGERRLISWKYAYLYGDSGKIDGVLASGADITDERNSKLALERSNRALKTISRCNEVMVHAKSEGELLNDVCRALVEAGGYLSAWTAFIREENGSHLEKTASYGPCEEIIQDVLADVDIDDLGGSEKVRTVRSDRAIRDEFGITEIHVVAVQDQGVPVGAMFLASTTSKEADDMELDLLNELADDLSYGIHALRVQREREYALQKLSQSEARSKAIIEGAYDAIIAINDKAQITQFNSAAQAMFGYTSKEALGQDVQILMPESYRRQHKGAIQRYAETREEHVFGQSLLLTGLRSNGQEFPIELTLSPMPEGMPDLCTAIIRDISDREEAERHRRQAQNMESIGNLAGGMAHDINNMLLPILNLTASVQKTLGEGTKEAKKLGMVLQAAERVKDLVQSVLEFSREDEPDFKGQDIHDIINHVLPLIQSTTPSSIFLKTEIDDFKGMVHADEKQISAALINMVSNAVDAIGGANGNITIQLKKGAPSVGQRQANTNLHPVEYAIISISDDGTGMSQSVLERMFDPFFTTKEPGQGTGLGMSMVHGVVTKHGGAINVSSTEGQGTRVDVFLPLLSPSDGLAPDTEPSAED